MEGARRTCLPGAATELHGDRHQIEHGDQYEGAIQLDPSDESGDIGSCYGLRKTRRNTGGGGNLSASHPTAAKSSLWRYNRLGEFQMLHAQYDDAARMFREERLSWFDRSVG